MFMFKEDVLKKDKTNSKEGYKTIEKKASGLSLGQGTCALDETKKHKTILLQQRIAF